MNTFLGALKSKINWAIGFLIFIQMFLTENGFAIDALVQAIKEGDEAKITSIALGLVVIILRTWFTTRTSQELRDKKARPFDESVIEPPPSNDDESSVDEAGDSGSKE